MTKPHDSPALPPPDAAGERPEPLRADGAAGGPPAPTPGEGAGQADVLEDDADAAGMEALADQLEAAGTIGPGEDKRTAGRRWVETSFALFPVVVARLRLGAKTVRDGTAALRRGEDRGRMVDVAQDAAERFRDERDAAVREAARQTKHAADLWAECQARGDILDAIQKEADGSWWCHALYEIRRFKAQFREQAAELCRLRGRYEADAKEKAALRERLDNAPAPMPEGYVMVPKVRLDQLLKYEVLAAPAAGAAREGERREEVRGG